MRVAFSDDVLTRLADEGLIHRAVQRVVLDITQGEFVQAWVQIAPDEETLRVIFSDPGVRVAVGEAQKEGP